MKILVQLKTKLLAAFDNLWLGLFLKTNVRQRFSQLLIHAQDRLDSVDASLPILLYNEDGSVGATHIFWLHLAWITISLFGF